MRSLEIRDPIHTFVRLDPSDRAVVDSEPLQRLRHIHQLSLSSFVYPGATHKRFEHSLGVMELAGRVFDVITHPENCRHDIVAEMRTDRDALRYWRRVLRMAALCHDIGHLPFSHAAEQELLPEGWSHERLTVRLIRYLDEPDIWRATKPPLEWLDIAKLAVGPELKGFLDLDGVSFTEPLFPNWESILSEIIISDTFGVDRMDYLLRDSYYAGVAYGRFDHHRLIDSLRVLPREYQDTSEPALGVDSGGLHSAEALLLARYFMYSQVYFHRTCKVYDAHLSRFLRKWLEASGAGGFPVEPKEHLTYTDHEVMQAMRAAARNPDDPGHQPARCILGRDHLRLFWSREPGETSASDRAAMVWDAARKEFGDEHVIRCSRPPKDQSIDFPVDTWSKQVNSALRVSNVLVNIPVASFDYVFIAPSTREKAHKWLEENLEQILSPSEQEEAHG